MKEEEKRGRVKKKKYRERIERMKMQMEEMKSRNEGRERSDECGCEYCTTRSSSENGI